jgi:hypothetical protein
MILVLAELPFALGGVVAATDEKVVVVAFC